MRLRHRASPLALSLLTLVASMASLVNASCASRAEAPPPAQPIDVPPPPPSPMPAPSAEPSWASGTPAPAASPRTLAGTIGGKPFVAESAVLVRVNEPSTATSSVFPGKTFDVVWSFLFIFDKPMGCADVPPSLMPIADRYVKYEVTGHWPFTDGTTYAVGSDPKAPAADRFAGSVWHGQGGSLLRGTVRIVRGATNPAVLYMDIATATANTETSGALRGEIAVTICR